MDYDKWFSEELSFAEKYAIYKMKKAIEDTTTMRLTGTNKEIIKSDKKALKNRK